MARVAKFRLRFLQQEIMCLRAVRGVAGGATDVVFRVLRVDGVHVLRATGVAGQAARVNLFGRALKREDWIVLEGFSGCRVIAVRGLDRVGMVLRGTVAGLAAVNVVL